MSEENKRYRGRGDWYLIAILTIATIADKILSILLQNWVTKRTALSVAFPGFYTISDLLAYCEALLLLGVNFHSEFPSRPLEVSGGIRGVGGGGLYVTGLADSCMGISHIIVRDNIGSGSGKNAWHTDIGYSQGKEQLFAGDRGTAGWSERHTGHTVMVDNFRLCLADQDICPRSRHPYILVRQ